MPIYRSYNKRLCLAFYLMSQSISADLKGPKVKYELTDPVSDVHFVNACMSYINCTITFMI